MAGNPARAALSDTREVSRHLSLIQPSSGLATSVDPAKAERIREKVRVKSAAENERKLALKKERMSKGGKRSALVPAEGGGMGMGMEMDS